MRWKQGASDAIAVVALVAVCIAAWVLLVRGDDDGNGKDTPRASSGTPTPVVSVPAPGAAPTDLGIELPDPKAIQSLLPQVRPPLAMADEKLDFVVSSFNVLGSSHTSARGKRPGMAAGSTRATWAGALLKAYGVEVVGLQELQGDQVAPLAAAAGGMEVYPGLRGPSRRDSENSIAWLPGKWQLVKAELVRIPYFGGRPRNMPVVRLKHRESGFQAWFMNFHNPATTPRWGNNSGHRARAVAIEAGLVRAKRAESKIPVFITGDMNDRAAYFCSFAGQSGMRSSNGGTIDASGCRPPARPLVDWIMATPDVEFLSHHVDRGSTVDRTSDHPLVLSRVRVDVKGGDGIVLP